MSMSKKKLIRAQAGVKLERIEQLAARQHREVCFRLSSRRATLERIIADEAEAQRAFAREVAASLEEAGARDLVRKGTLNH